MEVFGKSMVAPTNVIYLSSILGHDGPNPVHKCEWKCQNEHVCGNMYRCRLTGLTHICDKNCNQRILYDNHSSLCRVSKQIFPLTSIEQQAVKGVRRKLDAESYSSETCAFKRRKDAQCHPSPFERSFTAENIICFHKSQLGTMLYEANHLTIKGLSVSSRPRFRPSIIFGFKHVMTRALPIRIRYISTIHCTNSTPSPRYCRQLKVIPLILSKERNCFHASHKRNTKPKLIVLRLMNLVQIPPPNPLPSLQTCTNIFRTTRSGFLRLMASGKLPISLIVFSIFLNSCASTFIITNNCPYTIWPGTLSGSGSPPLPTTGFQLDSGQSIAIPDAPGWSGRIWARTGCTFDATGMGSCLTGDCGGKLECNGMGATPPASLFEITLGAEKDFYDVSMVDGYNLPLVAAPRGTNGACNVTGCVADVNMGCPKELQVVGSDEGQGGVVGCKSACEAFGLDQYCCSGEFANPTTCRPTFYSGIFKRACPRAYSYAFDDLTSTFTCKASEYAIVFCPNSGMRRIDDPPVRESSNEQIEAGTVTVSSSSAIQLLPLPASTIVLIIYTLYF